MVKLANVLSQLNQAKILVVGDLLLDIYTTGQIQRISPEAPVPVVHVQKEEYLPGGAGNVILNLLSLGAQVIVVGRIGPDKNGYLLKEILNKEGAFVESLWVQENYFTPVKNRLLVNQQQVVRIDHEQNIALAKDLEKNILESLPSLLQGIQAVAVSDYGKGLCTASLLKAIIEQAKQRQIPVITDPKGEDFSKYLGTTLIKPNLKEAYLAAKLPFDSPLEKVAHYLLNVTQAQWLMITRSEEGISLFERNKKRQDFPVIIKEVRDVTGAGDTVLAVLTYAIANQIAYDEATQLCNVAASLAIEQVGCARVTLSDLAERLLTNHQDYKIFNQEHLFVLKEVLKRHSYYLLVFSGSESPTLLLFQILKKFASRQAPLVVYIKEVKNNDLLLELLTSLKEVNFIVIHLESLQLLYQSVTPLESYSFDPLEEGMSLLDLSFYLSQSIEVDKHLLVAD